MSKRVKRTPLWDISREPYYGLANPSGQHHPVEFDSWDAYLKDAPWNCNCGAGHNVLMWAWLRHANDDQCEDIDCTASCNEDCPSHNVLQIVTIQWGHALVQHRVHVTEADDDSVRKHIRKYGTLDIMNV